MLNLLIKPTTFIAKAINKIKPIIKSVCACWKIIFTATIQEKISAWISHIYVMNHVQMKNVLYRLKIKKVFYLQKENK